MGWSQHMQTSWQPVWPCAGPVLVQLVTNDSELAAKYLCSPVIDPEAGAHVKLLSDRWTRDFLVNDSTKQSFLKKLDIATETTAAKGKVTTVIFLLFDLNCLNTPIFFFKELCFWG